MFSQLFIAACLFATGFAITVHDCPSNLPRNKFLKVHGNKCYHFFPNQKKEFVDAEDYCKNDGGRLAMVKTQGINSFIRNTIKHYGHHYAKVWIGLRYNYDETTFTWEDGTAVDYDNFAENRKYEDDCIFMKVQTGKWFNHDCDTQFEQYAKHYFVCEYSTSQHKTNAVKGCPKSLTRDKHLKTHGKKCYQFAVEESQFKNFRDAQKDCKKHGGHLAVVKTKQINNFIAKHLDGSQYVEAWIGLRYHPNPDHYRWVDGTAYDESLGIGDYEEDTSAGNCVIVTEEGNWFPEFCDDNHYYNTINAYVCEYPLSSSQATTTTITPSRTMTTPATSTMTSTSPEVTTASTVSCLTDLEMNEKKCYRFVVGKSQFKNFNDAQMDCQIDGGNLAVVKSKPVNTFIGEHLDGSLNEQTWIGLRYHRHSKNTSEYTWDDGTDFDNNFDNFDEGQREEEGDCVTMNSTGYWFAQFCDDHHSYNVKHGYICEYPSSQVTYTTILPSTPMRQDTTTTMLDTDVTTSESPEITTTMLNTDETTPESPEITTTMLDTDGNISESPEITTTMLNTDETTPESPEINTTMLNTDGTTSKSPEITTTVLNSDETTPESPEITTTMLNTDETTPESPEITTTMLDTDGNTSESPEITTIQAPKTTCATILCELDCGLDGYAQDKTTGCIECACNI